MWRFQFAILDPCHVSNRYMRMDDVYNKKREKQPEKVTSSHHISENKWGAGEAEIY